MPKPFANSQPITPSLISGDWLLGIQTGNSTGDNGLPQMKYIKLSQLSDWVRGTYGQIWRYRGGFSASLPSDAQDGDYFLATATFSVGADTYTKDHLYAYNGSSWDDISDILTQYASQSQVTDIDDRLTVVEVKVDAMGDGVVYKGEVATYADLAGIVDPQTGWEYFVTANASFYIYNGSSWDQIDNGIVQTITDGDTSHAPSGDAVYDALASEASAREAADSNLKSAIDANSKRITNLETKAGDEIPVTYPSATYGMDGVPASVAPYCKVRELIMNSRVRNQLIPTLDNFSVYHCTKSVSDGVATVSGFTGSDAQLYKSSVPMPIGQTALGALSIKPSKATMIRVSIGYAYIIALVTLTANVWTNLANVLTVSGSAGSEFAIWLNVNGDLGASDTVEVKSAVYTNLSVYFNGSIPSDADTIAEIQTNYPELLIPSDYDTGTRVDTTYSAVKSVGVNLFDEKLESGNIDTSTGQPISSTTAIRSQNFSDCKPSTSYYLLNNSSARWTLFEYDADGNFVDSWAMTANNYRVITTNARTRLFKVATSEQTAYGNNIQVAYNSLSTDVKTTYHPYMTDTLTLPEPVTGKSAGSVHQIYYPETGEMTEPLGEVTITSSNLSDPTDNGNRAIFEVVLTSAVKYTSPADVPNILMAEFITVSQNTTWASGMVSASYTNTNALYVIMPTGTTKADMLSLHGGDTITYELATKNPNSQATDPMPDPFIKVEGNGTIRPVQSQTTQIDSAMSVDYLGV